MKVPTLSDLPLAMILFQTYKINTMVNSFLLTGDKYMPEMHLRKVGFTYISCGSLSKNKKWT